MPQRSGCLKLLSDTPHHGIGERQLGGHWDKLPSACQAPGYRGRPICERCKATPEVTDPVDPTDAGVGLDGNPPAFGRGKSFSRQIMDRAADSKMHQEPCDTRLTGPGVWVSDDIRQDDWLLPIPDPALAEIAQLVETLRRHPMEITALDRNDYALDACAGFMTRVRGVLDSGVGFAVLDRLPVDQFGKDELKKVYWLLSGLIARPVAQSFDGRLLYDVRDTGVRIDTRVRGDLTRQELSWHTDYGFNHPPPHIGLLVLRTARNGGVSRVASMLTAHNQLRASHPALLARLYQPFWWNRQGEHDKGDAVTHHYPIFARDGTQIRARFIKWLLYKGYELMNETFDPLGQTAVETMFAIMSDPAHHTSFTLEAGQIQYVNNFRIAHCRTEYEDRDEPDARRHLVRIFLRDSGRRSFMG